MNELESLLQLNKMLLAESPQYLAQAAAFPPDAEAQWRLFRSLVNVRAPRPAGGDFLHHNQWYGGRFYLCRYFR